MKPIPLRRQDLAYSTVSVLNRFGRKVGRTLKAHVIETSGKGRGTVFEIHHPEVDRGEVLAILRLILAGYSLEAITPIMVTREREQPRFGARPG